MKRFSKKIWSITVLFITTLIVLNTYKVQAEMTFDDFIVEGTTLVEYVGDDTEVTIPDGITTIEGSAFSNSVDVKKLVIPDSVTTIKGELECWELESIMIGKGLCNIVDIENSIFEYCFELKSITVDEQNSSFSSIDGVLFDKDKEMLIHYPRKKTGTTYSIPDTVTRIASYAFDMTELYSIVIPNSVVEIESGVFQQCNNLINVNIPDSVTKLGYSAFYDCENLKNVSIGKNVFDLVYYNTFQSCYNLEKISISVENKYYTVVDDVVFNKNKTELIFYPQGKRDTAYIVPDTVSTIESYAFTGSRYLETVTIKHNISSISEWAFWGCSQFSICGYTNSYVENYAKANNINFISLGVNNSNSSEIVRKNGWINGIYYVNDVVQRNKWVDSDKYYTNVQGKKTVNKVVTYKNKKVFVGQDGKRATGKGWVLNKKYYVKKGVVQTGTTIKIGKKYFKFIKKGEKQSKKLIVTYKNKKYYVNKNGTVLKKGKKFKIGKTTYKASKKTGALKKIK